MGRSANCRAEWSNARLIVISKPCTIIRSVSMNQPNGNNKGFSSSFIKSRWLKQGDSYVRMRYAHGSLVSPSRKTSHVQALSVPTCRQRQRAAPTLIATATSNNTRNTLLRYLQRYARTRYEVTVEP